MSELPHVRIDPQEQAACRALAQHGQAPETIAELLEIPLAVVEQYLSDEGARAGSDVAKISSGEGGVTSGNLNSNWPFSADEYWNLRRLWRDSNDFAERKINEIFDSKIDHDKKESDIDSCSEVFIESKITDYTADMSYSEALDFISELYTPVVGAPPLSEAIEVLIGKYSSAVRGSKDLTISRAPALWSEEKLPNDTPPLFIQRHYSPWLGKGLSRSDIKSVDPQLYRALYNWMKSNPLPPDFDLPTRKELNDRWIDRVKESGSAAVTRGMDAREAARYYGAVSRRKREEK